MYQEENLIPFVSASWMPHFHLFLISFLFSLTLSTFLIKRQQLVVIREFYGGNAPSTLLLLASLFHVSWNSQGLCDSKVGQDTQILSALELLDQNSPPLLHHPVFWLWVLFRLIVALCYSELLNCLWRMWSGSLKAFRALVVCLPSYAVCFIHSWIFTYVSEVKFELSMVCLVHIEHVQKHCSAGQHLIWGCTVCLQEMP